MAPERGRERAAETGWPAAVAGRIAAAVAAQLLAERERWVLWLPVGFGAGIAGYFALPHEPPVWLGTAGIAFALLLALAGRLGTGTLLAALALAVVAGGFAAAQLRTRLVAAPVLADEHGPASVVARVAAVEPRETGVRLLLAEPEVARLAPSETPVRVRVTVSAGAPAVRPGDRVRLLAMLRPPPEPAAPGAFDFARRAYFQRLGAVGFAYGGVERLGTLPPAGWAAWETRWTGLRHGVAARVQQALPGEAGAVAAALMTGERGAIPEEVLEAMRRSGLAHLLAISGLHVGLIAGLVFFLVRGGLALWPWAALRFPIKKWAALASVLAAAAYLLLVGATVPTQRAFLMVAVVLLAVVLDRSALSMRLVAWAAFAVLALHPESLTGASFQMSFAAATALVAAYEALRARGTLRLGERGPVARAGLYLAGVALTSVVAILATAPFAVFHFNRLALFGLAANLVAVPLTAFWIMPWALAAYLLLPLGLEAWALAPMGWGIAAMLATARSVAAWPGATAVLPSPGVWALALVALGGLWLCLWQRPWRLLGLIGIAAGAFSLALVAPPDVLVSGDARLLALRGADGDYWLSSDRRARFTAEVWLRRAGTEESGVWPRAGPGPPGSGLACDPLGCILRRPPHVVALLRDPRALAEDCRRATVLVATVPVRRTDCAGPLVVVDRFDLWREGGHALRLAPDGVEVRTVRAARGARPWVRRRGRD